MKFLSAAENVGVARLTVAAMAGQIDFNLSEIEEIKVAVSEAVSNAVLHGYAGEQGYIEVEVIAEDGVLRVIVTDHGRGIDDLARARQPSFSTDPERMGLGFSFMESFMDQLEVSSVPGQGTRVEMVKRPGGGVGGHGQHD
ncbi:MAG: anti-sigma F factor [Firmicutes bacterium]|nr:anti-sigma F factor [Bacillota bacterium]MCL5038698.1 anti-sigma F factor [Bacillota bacterium]